jgi:hypothetical protein
VVAVDEDAMRARAQGPPMFETLALLVLAFAVLMPDEVSNRKSQQPTTPHGSVLVGSDVASSAVLRAHTSDRSVPLVATRGAARSLHDLHPDPPRFASVITVRPWTWRILWNIFIK